MQLNAKTILITGGTSGIGLELAKQLIKKTNKILICGKNKQKLDILKENLPEIEVFHCDVSNEQQLNKLAETIKNRFKRIDILINNAAIQERIDFLNGKNVVEDSKKEIKTNFISQVILTKKMLPLLNKSPEAAIVNLSSAVAYEPIPYIPIYCATKAAINSFSKSIRYQLKNTTIKVFCVFPPKVSTKLNKIKKGGKEITPEKAAKEIIKGIQKNKYEIRFGLSKWLYFGTRFFPYITHKIMQSIK